MPPKRKLDSEEEEDVDEELSSDEEGADEDEDMEVSDEEGGEDESEEEVLEPKVLPLRATRGGRMTQVSLATPRDVISVQFFLRP
jgi:hypothetical protein